MNAGERTGSPAPAAGTNRRLELAPRRARGTAALPDPAVAGHNGNPPRRELPRVGDSPPSPRRAAFALPTFTPTRPPTRPSARPAVSSPGFPPNGSGAIGAAPNGPAPARPPAFDPPPFRPHRMLRGGHAQTLAAVYWPGTGPFLAPAPGVRTARHRVDLGDGDALALHDLRPPDWVLGDPIALLVHGLGGSADSPYMVRIASKLVARGVRAFRLDHRTCGAGADLSRQPYHAGLSCDVRAAAWFLAGLCPGSPLGLAGFSMGGNMVLKALGEHAGAASAGAPDGPGADGADDALGDERLPDGVADGAPDPHAPHPRALPEVPLRGVAVNPAVDLAACCDSLTGPVQRFYDRHFAKYLTRHVANSPRVCPQQVAALLAARPRRIRDFDEAVTVPGWRFGSVDHYYARESAAPLVAQIGAPTLILSSADDPLVPADVVQKLTPGPGVRVHVCEGGGHLGYIARGPFDSDANPDLDRRWLDWRVVDWLTAPAGESTSEPTGVQAGEPAAGSATNPAPDARKQAAGVTNEAKSAGRLTLTPR